MAETMRCPRCAGLNPADAKWCGQCLTRFDLPEPEPEPQPAPPAAVQGAHGGSAVEGTTVEAAPVEGGSAATAPPVAAVGTTRGAFTVTDAGIVWTCARCETKNPIEETVCSVCGAAFADTVNPKEQREARDGGTAALYSLFLPGAGHAYVGLWGQAVARAILSLWAVLVFFVSVTQGGGGTSTLTAVVFALVATALWAIAAHDAYREARLEQGQVILKGRMFLYVVLGLLVLLMVLLTASGLSARNG